MELVRHQIRLLRQKNASGRWFVPETSLPSVLPREVVTNLLQDHCSIEPFAVEWMTNAIVKGAIKVFAILILIKEEKTISVLLEHFLQSDNDNLDSQLPFTTVKLETVVSKVTAGEFEDEQWIFLAPVFNHRLLHRNIQSDFILPFIEDRKLGQGGFGNVYEIVIPSGHHSFKGFDKTQPARLVRKELRRDSAEDDLWTQAGSNEHKIMSYLYHLEHPNILPLLTSYTYNNVPNFLIPLAKDGDLESMLSGKDRSVDFDTDYCFYEAMSGLSSALETLHEYKSDVLGTEMIGYHHDLKPKNVLVSGASFILSDFGLSKLKTDGDSKTPFQIGQGHYLAPECEDVEQEFVKGVVSRATDVWALGCIMLEVLVYLVGGAKEVFEFRQRRKVTNGIFTTRTFFHGRSINPEVTMQLRKLSVHENVSVRKTADLIGYILAIDIQKRPKTSQISARLRIICLEALFQELLDTFANVLWRMDEANIATEWEKLTKKVHELVAEERNSEDGESKNFRCFTAQDEVLFTDDIRMRRILSNMKRILKRTEAADLSDSEQWLLVILQQTNNLLNVQPADPPEADDEESRTAVPRIYPENPRHLRWSDGILRLMRTAAYNITISKDEKLLAVEHDWEITIYSLPCMEVIQEIRTPDELLPFNNNWKQHFPSMEFSPDSKTLFVSWKRHVCEVGGDDRDHKVVFTFLKRDWLSNAPMMSGNPLEIATISPNATKIALTAWLNIRSDNPPRVLYIVHRGSGSDRIVIGEGDCVFGFSPDGFQLAISGLRTVRRNKENVIDIQIVKITGDQASQTQKRMVTIACDEKFDEGPKYDLFSSIQDIFSPSESTNSRLSFATWKHHWVAALWRRSERVLALYDLSSSENLLKFDLTCLSVFDSQIRNVTVSDNLALFAGRKRPVDGVLRKLKGQKNRSLDKCFVFAKVETNEIVCILESDSDQYQLSSSGRYAIFRKGKEMRIFQILEG